MRTDRNIIAKSFRFGEDRGKNRSILSFLTWNEKKWIDMNAKKRLILGIACGVLAAMAMLVYAAQVRAEERSAREDALSRYGGEQIEVCVATRDILPGEELDTSNVSSQLWLVDLLPVDCITSQNEIIGSSANSLILANEPLSMQRVGDIGEDISVPDGLCAVSIPSQDVRAVGGAISRGSLVNVYASTDTGIILLGEKLLVLETSNSLASEASSSNALSWVTLAVTFESVQELLDAARSETLYLTLPSIEGDEAGLSATPVSPADETDENEETEESDENDEIGEIDVD
ncbi:MAG: Flp pilus assembly protein CpaB [Actinobacteria bacterium]|nr:Flp pilus assembly protein CpaB [Actinomycetota bacterium]